MEGIQYVTDERTKRRFVQIDLDKYGGDYLDDLLDGLVAASRKDEKSVPLAEALEQLRQAGKLDG